MVRLLTPAALASCPMLTRPAVSSTIFAAIPVTPCRHAGSPRLARGTVTTRKPPRPPPAAAPDTSRIVVVWILSGQGIPRESWTRQDFPPLPLGVPPTPPYPHIIRPRP